MAEKSALNLKSLKDQVYEYLRRQMENGKIRPGTVINMEETSRRLGISRTPLRDALLQLEMEGFVSIFPRRGVVVNRLSLEDIKNIYEIIGALESAALLSAWEKMGRELPEKMHRLNAEMKEAIAKDDFNLYYRKNLAFHDLFLRRCRNIHLARIVNTLKKRLYDFPRQEGFVKRWEETSIGEHEELVRLIEQEKKEEAARFIRDVHWSYKVQEKYVKQYYRKALAAVEEGAT